MVWGEGEGVGRKAMINLISKKDGTLKKKKKEKLPLDRYTSLKPPVVCYVFRLSEEEEEEGSYDSDEGQDVKAQPPPRDVVSSSPAMSGPTPSSVVKLEANQKARNKKERQELYGKTLTPPPGHSRNMIITPSQLTLYMSGYINNLNDTPCQCFPVFLLHF